MSGSWPDKLKGKENSLRPFWIRRNSLTVHKNVLLLVTDSYHRVVVPVSFQQQVLDMLHSAHWGIVRMKQMARRYVWWPSLEQDIDSLVKNCQNCAQAANMPDRTYKEWPKPRRPWQRVHVDYAGPFLGHMWLVVVDALSRFPYIVRMGIGSTTSKDTILQLKTIFSIEGLPETIVSDNGPQFASVLFSDFCRTNGIDHLSAAPFHPASNGEAERFVQTFKKAMLKNVEGRVQTTSVVTEKLHLFLSTYRSTPSILLGGKSPSEFLHGRQHRVLLSLLHPDSTGPRDAPDERSFLYQKGSLVYARNYGSGPRWIPGKAVGHKGNIMFLIRTERGIWKRHKNQLQIRYSSTSPIHKSESKVLGIKRVLMNKVTTGNRK